MFKKIFLITLLMFVSVVFPAQALPGKTKAEMQSWVKNHKFLSTWLQEIRTVGVPNYLLAYRELQDQWFIDLEAYLGDAQRVETESLVLVKKKPIAKSEDEIDNPDGRLSLDKRRWQNAECKYVWERNHEMATTLLTHIYGKDIADDFNQSKLAYQGPVFLHPIYFDTNEMKIDLDDNGKKIELNSITPQYEKHTIYVGKKYSYSRAAVGNSACRFEIASLAVGQKQANIFTYNNNVYKKLTEKKQQRDVPAAIKVE